MNAIAAPFVLPFRLMARYPWPCIIASALIAVACYFLNYGSGLAFFVCMGCGILIWYDEANRPAAADQPETA
ncbi:hypothetical protein [Pseudoroseomonas ludipueritiae]|uniref:Uncharacterized protein n=1 Tax=Pseudoroseomonas ludipueritiae TaxID=198093 RepID=A0ABR7R1L2_9PROT|nr:hypothetical protein [Pseudoroseomonas ludipueritiae]MBC9175627.1 hypothetical protein [Pseudoroseomonas ludipueritiae]